MQGPAKIISGIAAGVVALGVILWGVPYYIRDQVQAQIKTYAADNPPPDAGAAPAVVSNSARLQNLEAGQARIEGKVDAFANEFMRYLQRQGE